MRYIKQKLWYILWDIVVKRHGIYLTKNKGYLGKIMGYIMGYNRQYFEIIGYIKQQLIQNFGIYSATIMGYICKNYGIYFLKLWVYLEKPLDIMGQNGYI